MMGRSWIKMGLGSRAYHVGTEAKRAEAPLENKQAQGEKSLFLFAI